MARRLIALAAALLGSVAGAAEPTGEATLAFSPCLACTTRVLVGATRAELAPVGAALPAGTATHTVTGLAAGTYWFAVEQTFVDGAIVRAAPFEAQVALPKARPPIPPGLTVTQPSRDAFGVSLTRQNVATLTKVGTVKGGTACDPATSVNGLLAIPRSAVKADPGKSIPNLVVAECGQ